MAMSRERVLEHLERLDWSKPHSEREVQEELRHLDPRLAKELQDHVPADRQFRDPEEVLELVLRHYWREHPADPLSPWGHVEPGQVTERTREEHLDEPD